MEASLLARTIQRNKFLYILTSTLSVAPSITATGVLMQTFLATLGLSSNWIYIHATVTQAITMLTLLMGTRWVNSNNVIKRYAATSVPYALLFLAFLPFCFQQSASLETFIWLIVIGTLQGIANGMRSICIYILPYVIYPAKEYGLNQSMSGLISSSLSLALGALVSVLAKVMDYSVLMAGACIFAAMTMLAEAFAIARMKSILTLYKTAEEKKEVENKKENLWNTFRHPVFYKLAVPSVLRGFASGTTTVFAAMAFALGYDASLTTNMVYLQAAASLLGCGLIGYLSKHISIRLPVLIGSLAFLLLPLFFLGSGIVFLATFTLVIFFLTLINHGVPILLRNAVPMEIAGSYNAWRLVLHNAGSVLATTVATMISPQLLIGITIVCSVISGFAFFFSKEIRTTNS